MARKSQSKEATIKTAQQVGRELSRSPSFVSLYANDVQIHTSPWDMRLVFGEIGETSGAPNSSIQINQVGELRISPQLAKKLAVIIDTQIQSYEQTFGQIPDIPIPLP
jgi:hypothetical protein